MFRVRTSNWSRGFRSLC